MSVDDPGSTRNKAAGILGTFLIAFLNVAAILTAVVFISEAFVLRQPEGLEAVAHVESAKADELVKRGYYPAGVEVDPYKQFEVLDRHPVYGWFWATDENGRVRPQRTPVVTIDENGFRTTGGPRADDNPSNKPLAFVIGGSSAFGYRASGDKTTLVAYLNNVQTALFFINAGVNGWASSQELLRLQHQIVSFSPKLVISFTLGNDLERTLEELDEGGGTIEDYAYWIAPRTSAVVETFLSGHFPAFERWLRPKPSHEILQAAVEHQVDEFISNQEQMAKIARDNGFRFVTVIHPMTMTHDNVTIEGPYPDLYRLAVERALDTDYCHRNCLDYSDVFDQFFETIPVFFEDYAYPAVDQSVDPATVVFADQCHLLDRGNAIVAKKLAGDLNLALREPQSP